MPFVQVINSPTARPFCLHGKLNVKPRGRISLSIPRSLNIGKFQMLFFLTSIISKNKQRTLPNSALTLDQKIMINTYHYTN